MRSPRAVSRPLACTLAAVLLIGSAPVYAQDPAIAFERAVSLFEAGEFERAATALVELDASLALADPADSSNRQLRARSLDYIARSWFNLGDEEATAGALRSLVQFDPSYELDRNLVSPRLLEVFDDIRGQLVGFIDLMLDPPDAEVRLDGRLMPAGITGVAVPAGDHVVVVELPGHTAHEQEITLGGGERASIEATLVRNSAVVTFFTSPPGATIVLDGRAVGTTAPSQATAGAMSGALRVAGLDVGDHEVQVSLDGYRTTTRTFPIDDLRDYSLPEIRLELTRGRLRVSGLPEAATLTIGGQPAGASGRAGGEQSLELPPGSYGIEVDGGGLGRFATSVEILDDVETELIVRLRPTVVSLGVLGGDQVGARKLSAALQTAGDEGSAWQWIDRSAGGTETLAAAGFDTARLRAISPEATSEFRTLQAHLDSRAPGSLYVLAVLSDDVFADHAHLWLLPAGPGPATPDHIEIPLEDGADTTGVVAAALTPGSRLYRPYLGAALMNSRLSPGPVVFEVSPDSPAAAAGIRVGDVLLAIDETPVVEAHEVEARIEALARGADTRLRVARGAAELTIEVAPTSAVRIVEPDTPDLSFAALWATLASTDRVAEIGLPDWAVQLNRAVPLMRAGDLRAAVPLLRIAVDGAPVDDPVALGTARYLLGVALIGLGPEYYDRARPVLEAAAADRSARLFHPDGEPVWPRAWARLELLQR